MDGLMDPTILWQLAWNIGQQMRVPVIQPAMSDPLRHILQMGLGASMPALQYLLQAWNMPQLQQQAPPTQSPARAKEEMASTPPTPIEIQPLEPSAPTPPSIPTIPIRQDVLDAITQIGTPPIQIGNPNIEQAFQLPMRELSELTKQAERELAMRPVPPPTPQEQRLQKLLQQPDFVKDLVRLMTWAPERGKAILDLVTTFYPRATRLGEEAFQEQWRQREAQRRQEALALYQIRREAIEEKRKLQLEQYNQNKQGLFAVLQAMTASEQLPAPSEILKLIRQSSQQLTPQDFAVFRDLAKRALYQSISQQPVRQRQEILENLRKNGWITDAEYLEGLNWVERRQMALAAEMAGLKARLATLRGDKDAAVAMGIPASQLSDVNATISQTDELIQIIQEQGFKPEGLKDVLTALAQVERDIDNLRASMRGAIIRVATTLNTSIPTILQKLVTASPDDLLRSLTALRVQLPPTIAKDLLPVPETEKLENLTTRKALVSGLKGAISRYLASLPPVWHQDPVTGPILGTMTEWVSNLGEVEKVLETHIRDWRNAFDMALQAIEKAVNFLTAGEARLQELRLKEQGLALRAAEIDLKQSALALQRAKMELQRQRDEARLELRTIGTLLSALRLGVDIEKVFKQDFGAVNALARLADTIRRFETDLLLPEETRRTILSALEEAMKGVRRAAPSPMRSGAVAPEEMGMRELAGEVVRQIVGRITGQQPKGTSKQTQQKPSAPRTGGGRRARTRFANVRGLLPTQ